MDSSSDLSYLWLRVVDGMEIGWERGRLWRSGRETDKYIVWADEAEHFVGRITACPWRDGL